MKRSHPDSVIEALYTGDVQLIERYINEDNINLVDEDGYTLLSRAATATDLNIKIVRKLVSRGANVNIRLPQEQWTLLHSAAYLLRKDLVLLLLRAGADPNALDEQGQTALTRVLLAFNPKAELIEILLEHGADPAAKHGGYESAIELAVRTGQIDLFPAQ